MAAENETSVIDGTVGPMDKKHDPNKYHINLINHLHQNRMSQKVRGDRLIIVSNLKALQLRDSILTKCAIFSKLTRKLNAINNDRRR